ncbi:MAG: hypothetical protein HYR96_07840 [Deltaproteobacteria bacterium]|nr:hypothetical protein [Deltaproteobacteria bacterium]
MGRHFTLAEDPEVCEKQYSPLVLDLTGEGFKLTDAPSGVIFDLNATGNPIPTAWILGSNNAFLVLDRNNNGVIDDGGELFGSATTLSNGKRAANGFEALKEFDDNHDGVIDQKDAAYATLRLWFDRNKNAVTDRGELMTLKRAGVESISLNYVEVHEVDQYGNQTRQRSTFKRRSGSKVYSLQIIDIWFQTLTEN